MRDYYDNLVAQNFDAIIAIRDAFPDVTQSQIPQLRRGLRFQIRTTPIDPLFIVGVMEVESWFISEYFHFQHIHPEITCDRINNEIGYDPRTFDCQTIACPHDDLHRIYQLEGYAYRKKGTQLQRTVDCLDYGHIYFNLIDKLPDLKALILAMDNFFSPLNNSS